MKTKHYFKLAKREKGRYGLIKISEEELKAVILKDHPEMNPEKVLDEGWVSEVLFDTGYSTLDDYYGEEKYLIREMDKTDVLAITVNRSVEAIRTGDLLSSSSCFYVIPWDLGESIFTGCAKVKDGSIQYGDPFRKRFTNQYHPFAGIWIINYCVIADEDVTDLSFENLTMYRAVPKKQK